MMRLHGIICVQIRARRPAVPNESEVLQNEGYFTHWTVHGYNYRKETQKPPPFKVAAFAKSS